MSTARLTTITLIAAIAIGLQVAPVVVWLMRPDDYAVRLVGCGGVYVLSGEDVLADRGEW